MNEQLLQDILIFYELSLSVGSSLDLNENCDGFLKVLMSRRNLDFCSVWIKSEYIPGSTDDGKLHVVYANPRVKQQKLEIDDTFGLLKHLKDDQMYTIGSSDAEWANQIIEENVNGGRFFYYPLGDIGFLKLYSSMDDDFMNDIIVNKLKNIIKKFSISVRACLLQQSLFYNGKQLGAAEQIAI